MRLRTTQLRTEKYLNNAADALTWLNTTDASLNQVGEVALRARDLAIQAANGTLSDQARRDIAVEFDQLISDLVSIGNTKIGQRYLFSGENTMTRPFEITNPGLENVGDVVYRGTPGGYDPTDPGDSNRGLRTEVSSGIYIRVNVNGDDAIMPLIDALIEVKAMIVNGDGEGLGNHAVDLIDEAADQVMLWRAEAGARANRLELIRHRLDESLLSVTQLLSQIEDTDIAQAIMNLKMEENVYRLALASGARILQPTLLDFLR